MATIGMLYCRGARFVLPIRRSLAIIGGKSWSNSRYTITQYTVCMSTEGLAVAITNLCSVSHTYSTGLLRGRCVGWFVKLPILPGSLSSLPRSLLLLAPSLVCCRGLRTVALCKSVVSSRRHVPAAAEGKTPPISPPHLRWDQLWRFIKSDLILLTIAVAVSHINTI